MLRNGADSGEVVIEFEGDGQHLVASCKYSGSGSSLSVVRNGEPVSKPQHFIKKLWDAMRANPFEFLNADQKTRVKILLESMPVETPVKELREVVGDDWEPDVNLTAFEQIERLHARLYSFRTERNRELKKSAATVDNLSRDLPPGDPEDYREQIKTALSEKQRTDDAHRSELDRTRAEYEAAVEKVDEVFQPLKEEKSAEIARLEEASRQAHHVKGMKKTVDELRQGVKKTQAIVDEQTRQLESLKFLRENLIEDRLFWVLSGWSGLGRPESPFPRLERFQIGPRRQGFASPRPARALDRSGSI